MGRNSRVALLLLPILLLVGIEQLLCLAIGLRPKVSRTLDRLQDWIDQA